MKNKKMANLVLTCAVLTSGVALTSGCDKAPEFKVILNEEVSGIVELQPGETYVLYASRDDEKAANYTYAIIEGSDYATINSSGILTVLKSATVGAAIKVQAISDKVKSNIIELKVVKVKEIELTSNVDGVEVERNQSINLSTKYKGTTTDVSGVTYKITSGSEYATITNNVLTINYDAPKNASITVMGETSITTTNTLTFNVNVKTVESKFVIMPDYKSIEIDATSSQADKVITVRTLNKDTFADENLTADDYKYQVISGEEYVNVDSHGVVTSKGHGKAIIRITYESKDPLIANASADVEVTSIMPPEAISLNETLEAQKKGQISKLGFGLNSLNNDDKSLDLKIKGTSTKTSNFSNKYKIQVYVDGSVDASEGYATFNNDTGMVTFTNNAIGHTLRIVVLSDSGAQRETKTEFTINVNDGINVYDMQQLKSTSYKKNITLNLLSDCTLEGNSDEIRLSSYALIYYGNVSIFGNGHKIDFSKVVNAYTGGNTNYLTITNKYADGNNVIEGETDVKIYDLELKANNGYNKEYSNSSSPTKGSFDYAIRIDGADQTDVFNYISNPSEYKKRYNVYLDMNNIDISGFQSGLRVQYANSRAASGLISGKESKVSNIKIVDCLESGIETVASIMTFENVTLGRFGTTAMEVTPDLWWTAGSGFNQSQRITLKGTFVSENNNAFDNTYIGANSDLQALPLVVNSIAAEYNKNKVGYDFYKFIVESLKESEGEPKDATNLVTLMFNNVDSVTSGKTKTGYYKEAYNGSIVEFEELNGSAVDFAGSLMTINTKLSGGDQEGALQLLLNMVNSKFIKLEVVTNAMGKYNDFSGTDITNEEKEFLKDHGVEAGKDKNIGTIIVVNPLYAYRDSIHSFNDLNAIVPLVDLTNK